MTSIIEDKKINTLNSGAKDQSHRRSHAETEALNLLDYMKQQKWTKPMRVNETKKLQITLLQVNTVIINLSKFKRGESSMKAAKLGQTLLEQIETLARDNCNQVHPLSPNVFSYNAVLNCWAKSNGGKTAALNAENLLNKMILRSQRNSIVKNKGKSTHLKSPLPDIISYHSVLNAWAKSGTRDAGRKAQAIFDRLLETEYLKKDAPTPQTFAILLDAWANSGSKDAAERATDILNQIISVSTGNDCNRDSEFVNYLSIAAFNSVIKAWAKSGKGEYAALKAEEILQKMKLVNTFDGKSKKIEPDTISYNYLLDTWAKSRGKRVTKKVVEILATMHGLYDDGHNVKPNRFSYTIVINTLARSKERGGARKAEMILDRMLEYYRKSNNDLKPSTATFNAVIDAWARSGEKDAGQRAEAILDRLIRLGRKSHDYELRPNETSFNSTITAWARSGEEKAGEKAEDLISRMECYEDLFPDTITFNALISAYGNGRDLSSVSLAESVIDRMEEIYDDDDDDGEISIKKSDVRPNVVTYNTLIDVLAKSEIRFKARKAEDVLHRMILSGDSTLEPNIVTYSSILKACAHTSIRDEKEREEALSIAMDTFHNLRKSQKITANNITFRAMIDVCDRLILNSINREQTLRDVFNKCCEDGYLDNIILKRFRQVVSPKTFREMTGSLEQYNYRSLSVSELPPEWSREKK